MAEQDTSQERTEEPTAKRRRDVREKGQVPRSRELNALISLMLAAGALYYVGQFLVRELINQMSNGFQLSRDQIFETQFILEAGSAATISGLTSLAPMFAIAIIAAFAGPVLMGGWIFKLDSIAPKFEKLNPIKGLAKVFGPQGLMELVKALGKFFLIAGIAAAFIHFSLYELLALSRASLESALTQSGILVCIAFAVFSSAMILIAGIDVPFQLFQHTKQIRMTKQEVKDEMKETEGRPEVKGRIRQLQQEVAKRRMMQDVETADVVITNPTHFAVALRYKDDDTGAPVVVAKGRDLVALQIIEIARDKGVTVFRAPPLARALYASTDLQQEIPGSLYIAVAQVLAYVFQLRQLTRAEAAHLDVPSDLQIPDEYKDLDL